MKKKIILLVIITLIIVTLSYQYRKLNIISAYAAKELCSCVFDAGRNPDSVVKNDLNLPFIKFAKGEVDYSNRTVKASVWGLSPRTAVYREGFGCSLSDGSNTIQAHQNVDSFFTSQNNSLSWPLGNKVYIKPTVNSIFQQVSDSFFQHAYRTRSFLIIKNDRIVFERYAPGITDSTKLLGWSMTKSIFNALVGIMIKQEKLSLSAPLNIKEWQNDERKRITLLNLLQMNSGLKWDEDYTTVSDATNMLYNSNNMYFSAIEAKSQYKPGTHWQYSSGTSNIISGIMRRSFDNDSLYYIFPYKELFSKINAPSFIVETDPSGNFAASSYSYATTRDWGKLGLLYMHNGNWYGKQILPNNWITTCTTPAKGLNKEYGAHLWLYNSEDTNDPLHGMFMFRGHNGQRVFIIPSKQMVVVRLGLKSIDNSTMYEYLKMLCQ